MNILVVVNELITWEYLQDTILSFGYVKCCHTSTYEKSIALINEVSIDLVIIDLSGENRNAGVAFAELIHYAYKLPFMLVVSKANMLIVNRTKSLYPKGYLLKPFSRESIRVALEICLARVERENKKISTQLTESIFLKEENTYQKIPFENVLWVNAHNRKVIINTKNGEQIEQNNSLEMIHKSLPSHLFFKTHRSYIVNLTKIDAVNKNFVLIGEHFIPISDIKYKEFVSRINSL